MDIRHHEIHDVVHSQRDTVDVLEKEQGLQNIDRKAALFMEWIDPVTVLRPLDNRGMGVIQKLQQVVIEAVERNQDTFLLVLHLFGRLLKGAQHGPFSFRQMLAGCTVQTN